MVNKNGFINIIFHIILISIIYAIQIFINSYLFIIKTVCNYFFMLKIITYMYFRIFNKTTISFTFIT